MAHHNETNWKTGGLVLWVIVGIPVYLVTLALSLLAYPVFAWFIIPVYLGGFVLLATLFIQWHKAVGPIPREFKVWTMLYIVEKFCLGCTIAIVSSKKLFVDYPFLCLIPLALGMVLHLLRYKWFSSWKENQSKSG